MSSSSETLCTDSSRPAFWLNRLADGWRIEDDQLRLDDRLVMIRNGIPRFVADAGYSEGNFSKLRDEFPQLQLDSVAGGDLRMQTILDRTGWEPSEFKGKSLLECGCGAGPDTQILLKLGASVVAADIAGIDTAKANLKSETNVAFLQSSIDDLPLRKESFDIVFCHRVLQHTPDPEKTLRHILQFVKPEGHVFVHSYARTFRQMVHWKYILRPLTTRMNPETLYRMVRATTPPLLALTNLIRRIPPQDYLGKLLYLLSQNIVPVYNRRFLRGYEGMEADVLREHAIHDTFDALSPKHDHPISATKMRHIASEILQRPFEIDERGGITLLRTRTRP